MGYVPGVEIVEFLCEGVVDADALWEDVMCKMEDLSCISSAAMVLYVIVKVLLESVVHMAGGVVGRC